MRRVGIRELSQDASTWVRRAAAGEEIEITDRGRAVARLGPTPAQGSGIPALEAEGRIRPAKGKLSDHKALPIRPGSPTLSEILAGMRAQER